VTLVNSSALPGLAACSHVIFLWFIVNLIARSTRKNYFSGGSAGYSLIELLCEKKNEKLIINTDNNEGQNAPQNIFTPVGFAVIEISWDDDRNHYGR